MRQLCGFVMFWIGIGMGIMLLLPFRLWVLILIVALIAVGYQLFCS